MFQKLSVAVGKKMQHKTKRDNLNKLKEITEKLKGSPTEKVDKDVRR